MLALTREEELSRQLDADHYNPMNDVLFKFIFGKEERKQITIDFLNAVLQQSLGHAIADICFEQTEKTPEHEDDKLTRLDVACALDTGEQVDVEVQVVNEKNIQRRTLYYWAQMYLMSLPAGKKYQDLRPDITINILGFSVFHHAKPHSRFILYDEVNSLRLSPDLELHFLEIPKYAEAPKKPIGQLTKMERWLAYFANQLTKEERRELAMKDEKIKDAMDATQVFLSDKEERRRYINREMAIMDRLSEIASAREDEHYKTKLEDIRSFVAATGWSVEHVMDVLKIPQQDRPRYLDLLQKNLH